MNYEEILPQFTIANLLEIEKMKVGFKIPMMKKLINNDELLSVKIGSKIHVARSELIRYLTENTK